MRWCASFLALLGTASHVLAMTSFENTAIVRTIEPAGALVHVTTTYAVKLLEEGAHRYIIALSERDAQKTSWMEAKIKNNPALLTIKEHGVDRCERIFVAYRLY
jgi:oligosaccharyltransferase complex subunit alpha (ribophorin I)